MIAELKSNGCEVRKNVLVESIEVKDGKVVGVRARSKSSGNDAHPIRNIQCNVRNIHSASFLATALINKSFL